MGRSGGFGGGGFGGFGGGFGGGGGHFSGGFGGGSHSSGGRSGGSGGFGGFGSGGRSSGGYSGGHGSSGDFWTGVFVGNLLGGNGGSRRRSSYNPSPSGGGGNYGGGGGRNNTSLTPSKPDPYKRTKIAAVIVAFIFLMSMLTSCFASVGSSLISMDFLPSSQIQTTHAREALPVPAQSSTYFDDQDGDWIYSPNTVNKAMRYFEEKTGVTPYLVILPNGSSNINQLQQMTDEMYYQLFSDENHMLLLFCDDGRGSYKCGYSVGSAAATVTDEEAMEILSRYLDRYYSDYSIDESEIFANTYMKTADSIMSYQAPDESDEAAESDENPYLGSIVILVVGGIIVGIFFLLDNRREKQRKKDELTKEILNTPLEKFGDKDLEDLADKYEK